MHIHYKYIYTIYIYIARLWNERGNFLFQQTCVSSRGKKSSPKSPALYYTTERVIYQTNKWVRLFFLFFPSRVVAPCSHGVNLLRGKSVFFLHGQKKKMLNLASAFDPDDPSYILHVNTTHIEATQTETSSNRFGPRRALPTDVVCHPVNAVPPYEWCSFIESDVPKSADRAHPGGYFVFFFKVFILVARIS